MYRKNVAGQRIGFAMVTAATGAADTGATVSVFVVIDGAAQAAGGGSVTNKTNGQYSYAMTQAETNGNNISFLFVATGDVPVEKTIVTTAADPTDAVRFGLTALPNAAAGASGGVPLSVDSAGGVNTVEISGTAQTAADVGALGASITELSQAQPPKNPTLLQAVMLLYMAFRNNFTITGSARTIQNDAGTVIAKATLSDDGVTYTEAKLVSGP